MHRPFKPAPVLPPLPRPFPLLPPLARCLRCAPSNHVSSVSIPFALHNKVKVLIPLREALLHFRLTTLTGLTDEDGGGVAQQRCQRDLLLVNDMPFEMIHSLGTDAKQLLFFNTL